MTRENGLLLTEYKPRSELVVEREQVTGPKFPVIDIHAHFGPLTLGPDFETRFDPKVEVEKLKSLGVVYVTNLETLWGAELERVVNKIKPYDDFILTFGSVDIKRLDEPDFAQHVEETLKGYKQTGIHGLKLWKNISLGMKDKAGKYIPIDDPRLKPIWDWAAELNLPIVIHIADPVAFFRPVDQYNERWEELQGHPDWSFYKPGLFTFEELMEQQENMLAQNPDTTFIIAHGGSYSENLGWVAQCLDKYPNMYIDTAARLAEFGRQPYTSRKFFTKYQDRILFGTDCGPGWYEHLRYYEFFETWNEYFDYGSGEIPGQGRWKIYGIHLDDEALEKIYYKNAARILGLEVK